MSLTAMLAAHDDAALAALASPGLVRRASRDAAAGKAKVLHRDDEGATVDADGQTVALSAKGPQASTCPCPATGLCRHILLALIAARDMAQPAAAEPADAEAELADLSDDEFMAFAGADLAEALTIAAAGGADDIARTGPNLTVHLEAHPDPVTFIAGQGLRGAVFKGPKTRKRRAVAAAAALVRRLRGIAAPAPQVEAAGGPLEAAFLDTCTQALEDAARSVLTGTPALARDRLFDLGISARAGTAPRLAGELRGLAAETTLAEQHHVAFDEAAFLGRIAGASALVAALREAPDDIALTGTLRRDYEKGSPAEIWLAGAVAWQTGSGARGLRVHAIDLGTGAWLGGGSARGAGMDPGFTPSAAYRGALWGAGIAAELIGCRLHFDAPLISPDGMLSGQSRAALVPVSTEVFDRLRTLGTLHDHRDSLIADIARRRGAGLRASVLPCPVLLKVGKPLGLSFDDLDQSYTLTVSDAAGQPVPLRLTARDTDHALYLERHLKRGDIMLCEAMTPDRRLIPVTRLRTEGGHVRAINLTLDRLDTDRSPIRDLARKLTGPAQRRHTPTTPDPLTALAQRALDASVAAVAYGSGGEAQTVATDSAALGLDHMARAASRLAAAPTCPHALRLAYLASQVRQLAGRPAA